MELCKLKEPFPSKDIEWRIQRSGTKDNKPWAMVLAYVTNRAIMERLDEIVGPENWQNDFKEGPNGGLLCSISIRVDSGIWVKKWDGADNTQVEAIKGGLSGAMKRAAVQWGIGRYLYNLDTGWALFADSGRYKNKVDGKYFSWNPPALPAWALPGDESPKKQPTGEGDGSTEESQETKPTDGPWTDAQRRKIFKVLDLRSLNKASKKTFVDYWMPEAKRTKLEAMAFIDRLEKEWEDVWEEYMKRPTETKEDDGLPF